MKILLIGEYSNLHNSLKQGLVNNGHNVVLLSNGDGFKNYEADILIKSSFFEKKFLKIISKVVDRLTGISLNEIELFIRTLFKIKSLKKFDVVQLINERAFKTSPRMEKILLKNLFGYLMVLIIESLKMKLASNITLTIMLFILIKNLNH